MEGWTTASTGALQQHAVLLYGRAAAAKRSSVLVHAIAVHCPALLTHVHLQAQPMCTFKVSLAPHHCPPIHAAHWAHLPPAGSLRTACASTTPCPPTAAPCPTAAARRWLCAAERSQQPRQPAAAQQQQRQAGKRGRRRQMRQGLRGGGPRCRLRAATCCMCWWTRRSRSRRR